MFVRKCDCCGVDSTSINDKNFLSFTVDFGILKTSLDFCPSCWAKNGTEVLDKFGGGEGKNEVKNQVEIDENV